MAGGDAGRRVFQHRATGWWQAKALGRPQHDVGRGLAVHHLLARYHGRKTVAYVQQADQHLDVAWRCGRGDGLTGAQRVEMLDQLAGNRRTPFASRPARNSSSLRSLKAAIEAASPLNPKYRTRISSLRSPKVGLNCSSVRSRPCSRSSARQEAKWAISVSTRVPSWSQMAPMVESAPGIRALRPR